MDHTVIFILVITFAATLLRSTFGFGESLLAVPLLILFMDVEVAVPLSVLVSVSIALIVVVQDHSHIHFQTAKWLILFAVPGIPIGLLLLLYGSQPVVKAGLGMVIILYTVYALFAGNAMTLQKDSRLWLFGCGFLSGVFGGAYGLNGPPLAVYGTMRRWSAPHFRATLQAYFLPASFIGLVGYGVNGLLNSLVLKYFLISLPAVIPAVFLGRYLNRRLNHGSFFRYIYVGLMCIGIFLVFDALTGM